MTSNFLCLGLRQFRHVVGSWIPIAMPLFCLLSCLRYGAHRQAGARAAAKQALALLAIALVYKSVLAKFVMYTMQELAHHEGIDAARDPRMLCGGKSMAHSNGAWW